MKKFFLFLILTVFLCNTESRSTEFEFWWTPADISSNVGLETDGEFFYSCKWNDPTFRKMDKSGNTVETFTITGVTKMMDLAYDGQYFYGGNATNVIYILDFTNKTLVGTIASPNQTVRNISYVPEADGGSGAFWVGNWDNYGFSLVSRNGIELDNMNFNGNPDFHGSLGSAYDNVSAGGPYLWLNPSDGEDVLKLFCINLNTKSITKREIPVIAGGYYGGGLCFTSTAFEGKNILAGNVQTQVFFGIDMSQFVFAETDAEMSSTTLREKMMVGETTIKGTIINVGYLNPITSFDVSWQVDNGDIHTASINANIALNGEYTFTHPDKWNATSGVHNVKVFVSNVNGGADVNYKNDTLSKEVNVLQNVAPKKVLFEEFSTTACGYCPDGHLVLQQIIAKYPNSIVPLIHHAGFGTDKMTIPESETYAGVYSDGAPTAAADRKLIKLSRGTWEKDVLTCLDELSPVSISLNNSYNSSIKEVSANVTVKFLDEVANADYRVNLFLIEKTVIGSGSGYDQANYYNTTSGHPMYGRGNPIIGYEHRHVIRKVVSDLWGTSGVIPNNPDANTDYTKNFTFLLDDTWNPDSLTLAAFVSLYTNVETERYVLNANEIDLDLISSVEDENDAEISIYPVPANDFIMIRNAEGKQISIYDLMGQKVMDTRITNNAERINLSNFAKGMYSIKINNSNTVSVKSFIVE
ncbi:MAG TPA: Omp28-related outer membrane protein [Candidatus Kapabacteria bacterium]|nr:Omp28-related outer membrane protein [Candidatus Kapabacteria bacterium]HPO63985.1 Omp28-related outer membrane protein [Candidatus Kapabacteria bacterium]